MREAQFWQAKAWYYHTTIWKSNLGSQESIGHIYVFDSPCARVFFHEKMQKKWVICEILMCEAKSWQANTQYYHTTIYKSNLGSQASIFYIYGFLFHHVQGTFFLRKHRKKRWFVKYSWVKPNLDRQNTWYYHTTICKSNPGSQALICHIYGFDSLCARVFFHEKTQKKRVICEISMREATS